MRESCFLAHRFLRPLRLVSGPRIVVRQRSACCADGGGGGGGEVRIWGLLSGERTKRRVWGRQYGVGDRCVRGLCRQCHPDPSWLAEGDDVKGW